MGLPPDEPRPRYFSKIPKTVQHPANGGQKRVVPDDMGNEPMPAGEPTLRVADRGPVPKVER